MLRARDDDGQGVLKDLHKDFLSGQAPNWQYFLGDAGF